MLGVGVGLALTRRDQEQPNLLTNPGFETGDLTGWYNPDGTTWSVVDEQAVKTGHAGSNSNLWQLDIAGVVISDSYRIVLTILEVSGGSVQIFFNDQVVLSATQPGTYSVIAPAATDGLGISGSATHAIIDDVKMQHVPA